VVESRASCGVVWSEGEEQTVGPDLAQGPGAGGSQARRGEDWCFRAGFEVLGRIGTNVPNPVSGRAYPDPALTTILNRNSLVILVKVVELCLGPGLSSWERGQPPDWRGSMKVRGGP